MNLKDEPVADLPYDAVPGAQLTDAKTFFWSSPIFGKKILQKSRKCLGPRAMYIQPGQ